MDFEKAYDSINWRYLDDVIRKNVFLALWRKWMKECTRTTITVVLENRSPTEEFFFFMEMGLRQGDHLSPFLFLLAAEGFRVMMETTVENKKKYSSYQVGSYEPTTLSHLQFAEDTLVLGEKS